VWDPFREFQEISDRLNRYFQSTVADSDGDRNQALRGFDWAPAVNISETDKSYVIKVDLPQVKKEDVKVTSENGVLTIEGERKQEKREESEKFHRVETAYGRFLRRFSLPEDAQEEQIQATYKDGALEVSVPKAADKTPKAHQISVN
jgi:HSP20 family protein